MNIDKFSVIAIDDNEDDIYLLELLLRRAGMPCPLRVYHTGARALASLTQNERSNETNVPGLLFLDKQMPGMGGLEVLQSLRQQPAFDDTAVVMLSSCDDPVDLGRAAALGAQCYLLKHPTVDEITRIIEDARSFFESTSDRNLLFRGAYNRMPLHELEIPGVDRGQ